MFKSSLQKFEMDLQTNIIRYDNMKINFNWISKHNYLADYLILTLLWQWIDMFGHEFN